MPTSITTHRASNLALLPLNPRQLSTHLLIRSARHGTSPVVFVRGTTGYPAFLIRIPRSWRILARLHHIRDAIPSRRRHDAALDEDEAPCGPRCWRIIKRLSDRVISVVGCGAFRHLVRSRRRWDGEDVRNGLDGDKCQLSKRLVSHDFEHRVSTINHSGGYLPSYFRVSEFFS